MAVKYHNDPWAKQTPATPSASNPKRRVLNAKYDSAQTTVENSRHWAWADNLSANAANSPGVRRTIRNRARYEIANNSYGRGIVNTLADDVVGTGPRLQMLGRNIDPESNQMLERLFHEWADAIGLASKLRTMRMARCQDGETFGILLTNPNLDNPVTLDIQLIEADRVASPELSIVGLGTEPDLDGIIFDKFNNPISYQVLQSHPGDGALSQDAVKVPAKDMIHWFRPDRPGQARGVSEITSALPLFAMLRRYTLAVIAAAESAADFAGILHSDLAPDDAALADPFDTIALERNMLVTMPDGYDMTQIKAEQPVTTYGEFKKEILGEIARCISMPINIASANSGGFNFASGRLDHQTYFRSIEIDRASMTRIILNRIFARWMEEATLISGYLPQVFRMTATDTLHQWIYSNRQTGDPRVMALADQINLESDADTLAEVWARKGKDWRTQLAQRGEEKKIQASQTQEPIPEGSSNEA